MVIAFKGYKDRAVVDGQMGASTPNHPKKSVKKSTQPFAMD
jgi:hypothetical protein